MSTLLEQASLVMIPSGYKEDVVYSQIPTNGNGDLAFTRASNGTRVNSQGLVEVVPWNLVTYSNDFSSSWALIEASKSTGITDPIGNLNAIKLKYTTATSGHYITQGITLTGSNAHSVYAKAGELQFLQIASAQSIEEYANFNLSTGAVGTYGSYASNVQIENVGNGWYRCSVVFTNGTNGIYLAIVQSASSDWFGVATYAGANSTNGLYLYGGQVNFGTLKPYFPTTDRLNVPRLTYQNGGGGCPSLLLEKQSTNLQIYSEQFDLWSNTSDLTVSANASTSPDGTQNADKLNENSSNAYHIIGDANITLSASTIYTTSFFAKASERSYARMLAPAGNYSTESAYFDLTNGNCSASAGTVLTQSMGDGWYRCIWSLTTSSSVSGGIGMWFGPARNMTDAYNTYTGTNGSGIYAYGAQIE